MSPGIPGSDAVSWLPDYWPLFTCHVGKHPPRTDLRALSPLCSIKSDTHRLQPWRRFDRG